MAINFQPKRAAKIADAPILTREDFTASIAALDTNLVELAKGTGIHRQYLSEFKNGSRNLQPSVLRQLRDYFEEQGIEFDDDDTGPAAPSATDDDDDDGDNSDLVAGNSADGATFVIPQSFVDEALTQSQRDTLLKRISANEARAEVILKKKVSYGDLSVFFEDPEPTDEAETAYTKLIAIFADTYLTLRTLHGTPQVQALAPQLAERGACMPTFADLIDQRFTTLAKITAPRGKAGAVNAGSDDDDNSDDYTSSATTDPSTAT